MISDIFAAIRTDEKYLPVFHYLFFYKLLQMRFASLFTFFDRFTKETKSYRATPLYVFKGCSQYLFNKGRRIL